MSVIELVLFLVIVILSLFGIVGGVLLGVISEGVGILLIGAWLVAVIVYCGVRLEQVCTAMEEGERDRLYREIERQTWQWRR